MPVSNRFGIGLGRMGGGLARDLRKSAVRAVAMMRHGFGGHPYGENAAIKRERRHGRVGEMYAEHPADHTGERP
jgi:6-phosphogluconate dehydrogenase